MKIFHHFSLQMSCCTSHSTHSQYKRETTHNTFRYDIFNYNIVTHARQIPINSGWCGVKLVKYSIWRSHFLIFCSKKAYFSVHFHMPLQYMHPFLLTRPIWMLMWYLEYQTGPYRIMQLLFAYHAQILLNSTPNGMINYSTCDFDRVAKRIGPNNKTNREKMYVMWLYLNPSGKNNQCVFVAVSLSIRIQWNAINMKASPVNRTKTHTRIHTFSHIHFLNRVQKRTKRNATKQKNTQGENEMWYHRRCASEH